MTAATLKQTLNTNPWMRRLGTYGFLFFFVKGLLWLTAPLVFYFFV